jgi:hypothetical protein
VGRRFVVLVSALPLVVGGVAFLASNSVATSNAGGTEAAVVIDTALTPATAGVAPGYDITMSATLAAQGLPLSGQSVAFATGGESCSAVTDSTGTASCTADNITSQPSSYTANFAGVGPLRPSSAAGQVGS